MTTPHWSDRARELLAAATPGPWHAVKGGRGIESGMRRQPVYDDEGNRAHPEEPEPRWTVSADPLQAGWCTDGGYSQYCVGEHDAALIAAAPELLTTALAEREQLGARDANLTESCEIRGRAMERAEALVQQRDATIAEQARRIEELNALVAWYRRPQHTNRIEQLRAALREALQLLSGGAMGSSTEWNVTRARAVLGVALAAATIDTALSTSEPGDE